MSTTDLITAPAAPEDTDHLAASLARVEHRLRLLDELAELAMTLARHVTERAVAEEIAQATDAAAKETPSTNAADDIAKLSRAVRLTLDLAGRLEEAIRRLRSGEVSDRAAARHEVEQRAFRMRDLGQMAARDKVAEQVTVAIIRESESERECTDLVDALEQRLNDDIAYVDVADQPLREAVERLCADLGLTPDWSGWTDDGWPDDVLGRREPWSPFNKASRKPVPT